MNARITIYPAGSEFIGLDSHGEPIAGNEHGAGAGVDVTSGIVPGSIRPVTR